MLSEIDVAESIKEFFWDAGDTLHVPHALPSTVRAVIVACFISIVLSVIFMKVRQIILRGLLAYRGWMYDTATEKRKLLGTERYLPTSVFQPRPSSAGSATALHETWQYPQ
ncbi:hypothetical protein ISCGN_004749 [Ixodes scapularis]